MTTEPQPDVAGGAEEGEEVLATTQLQVRALGLTGALMQNITAIAPAITAFFFTATIVGFTGAISPFAYFSSARSCRESSRPTTGLRSRGGCSRS
jgi:hypothetical protein